MPIKFEQVSHTYALKTPFEHTALKQVDVSLKQGSFTAVIGHTGSGKSTLIQHMNALLLPTTGMVSVNGIDIVPKKTPKKVKAIRQFAGVVFQFPEYQLFEETVEQDVMFGPLNFGKTKEEAKRMAHKVLRQVGLDESFFSRSPFELSGGERRRVAIAGILAFEPKVLVLDEPTAGLDPEGTRMMMELFKSFNAQGMTIVLVTHDMDLMYAYANEVCVMEEGKIVLTSPVESLFDHPLVLKAFEKPSILQWMDILESYKFASKKHIKNLDAWVEYYHASKKVQR
jgi:energy-coupling factor transport system ATP-binding protein